MTNEKLFKAVETNNATEVKKALSEEKINTASNYGVKSIILATEQENSEILKMLLQNGEKINRENFWRRTALLALSIAIQAENIETVKLLLEYGAGADKKILNNPTLLSVVNEQNTEMIALLTEHGMDMSKKLPTPTAIQKKQKLVFEDGIFIPKKGLKDNLVIRFAKEGNIKQMKNLLAEGGISENALVAAVDAAFEKNKPKMVALLLEHCEYTEMEVYAKCLIKMFLRDVRSIDIENAMLHLNKLVENVVGVLTDDTGRSTLEIAVSENFDDVVTILKNYGFQGGAFTVAYGYLVDAKNVAESSVYNKK